MSFGLSANGAPKISLSEGSDLNVTVKPIRTLETAPFHYSLLDQRGRVQVNFGDSYSKKNPFALENKISIVVIISSNETGLFTYPEESESPFGFNCDPSYCEPDNSSTEYKFSWVTGDASRINLNTSLSIAFGAWELHISPLYFSKEPKVALGREIGWIGLGTGSNARKNFQAKNPIFSIVYDSLSKTGNLIFGFNSTLVDNSKPPLTFTTTPNWEMQLASVSVGDKSVFFVNSSHPLKIIFDLRSQDASLPEEMFNSIINELSSYTTECFEYNCFPKTREGLPPIVFTLADNTQFSLSPEIYVQHYTYDDGHTDYFTMNMRYKGRAKFTENTILFGRLIMSHFYTVFQQIDETNTITFYAPASNVIIEQEPSTPPPIQTDQQNLEITSDLHYPFDFKSLIIGICVTLIVWLILVIISRRKKNETEIKGTSQNRKMNMELSQSDSDETPLKI